MSEAPKPSAPLTSEAFKTSMDDALNTLSERTSAYRDNDDSTDAAAVLSSAQAAHDAMQNVLDRTRV